MCIVSLASRLDSVAVWMWRGEQLHETWAPLSVLWDRAWTHSSTRWLLRRIRMITTFTSESPDVQYYQRNSQDLSLVVFLYRVISIIAKCSNKYAKLATLKRSGYVTYSCNCIRRTLVEMTAESLGNQTNDSKESTDWEHVLVGLVGQSRSHDLGKPCHIGHIKMSNSWQRFLGHIKCVISHIIFHILTQKSYLSSCSYF